MHQCPCCDYFALDSRGEYEICPVCFWEDDGVDIQSPDAYSGPNHMTLRQGRRNFASLGACAAKGAAHVLPRAKRAQFKVEPRKISLEPPMRTIHIDGSKIQDWPSFFDEFARAFGFPDFFGRSMDAWIDCMTRLDEEMSEVRVAPGELVCIALDAADVFKTEAPEQYLALVECTAFVNWRRIDAGGAPILVLSFHV